jgi:hypothetical protein
MYLKDKWNIIMRSSYIKRNIVMRSLIHVDRYFEYRDEENPHTVVLGKIPIEMVITS